MAERQILSQLTTKNPHQNNDTIENRTIILNKKMKLLSGTHQNWNRKFLFFSSVAVWYPLKLSLIIIANSDTCHNLQLEITRIKKNKLTYNLIVAIDC